ncbi:MAG: hypothetical protein ACF8NJ_08505 [Phycisphaerales bacterium JB038]
MVLSTLGGSVLLMKGDQGPTPELLGESADFGWGGIALAVADLDDDGTPESVHGVRQSNHRFANEQQAASIQVLHATATGDVEVVSHGGAPFYPAAENDPQFPCVGIAGVAVAEVFSGPEFEGKELVVATLDGYLLVYKIDVVGSPGSPTFDLTLVSSIASIGALGAHCSIHVGDYVTNRQLSGMPDGKVEIYVAGSMGMRRFDLEVAP